MDCITDIIQTDHDKIAKQIMKQHDEFLMRCFEKYGIDLDYIKEHNDEFRVEYQGNKEFYYHNGKFLFGFEKQYKEEVNEDGTGIECVVSCVPCLPD